MKRTFVFLTPHPVETTNRHTSRRRFFMVTPHHSDQSTASQRKGKPLQFNFNSSGGAFGFFAGSLEGFVTGDGHAHAAFAFDVGFAEEAQLGVGRGEGGVEISETDLGAFAFHEDDRAGAGAVLRNAKPKVLSGFQMDLVTIGLPVFFVSGCVWKDCLVIGEISIVLVIKNRSHTVPSPALFDRRLVCTANQLARSASPARHPRLTGDSRG